MKLRLHTKCSECNRTQYREILDAQNQAPCWFGKPGAPCPGTISYHTDDADQTLENAASILHHLNATTFKGDTSPLAVLVDTAAEDIGAVLEGGDTPREMGWVGSNGLP